MLRAVLLVLCSALSALADVRTFAALPVALLASLTLAADRIPLLRRHPVWVAAAEALFTGFAVAWTGGGESPLLPYLLAPTFAVGLTGTVREVALVTVAAVAGLATGAMRAAPEDLASYTTAVLLWVVLGLVFGLVAGWAQRLVQEAPVPTGERYAEVRSLLEDLRRSTRRLPGTLDVASAAEVVLQSCADLVPTARSAVLVQPTSQETTLVPAAVRGMRRVPWRAPPAAGPLQRAWDGGEPVLERRAGDENGRRRGSALLAMPVATGGDRFGLVVLESFDDGAFPAEQVQQLVGRVMDGALRLEAALLFDDVRSTVVLEERDRLAREMHDGVAQELASIGYQLDNLRSRASRVDPTLSGGITDVRTGLTRLISDIRLSITDLKTSVSSDRGLGSALTSYVRAVGSGGQITVHVTMRESAFRLPGEQEVLLLQIAQAVSQDVRRTTQPANLWVSLVVHPPSARLVIEHDVGDDDRSLDLSEFSAQLAQFGGTVQTGSRSGAGVRVEVVLEGGDRAHQRAARR